MMDRGGASGFATLARCDAALGVSGWEFVALVLWSYMGVASSNTGLLKALRSFRFPISN